ncbi:MAG: MerR family transcriptional regulator, partial [Gracilibacteraceae bacterium]|nr:MerR family transcriptional regulator [Gracilibacteraceae bacterium]
MNLYTIGETASITGISVKTLRFYDEQCILKPEKRNMNNNYRYYSEKQLAQILLIKTLRKLGLSLHDISTIINQEGTTILEEKLKNKIAMVKEEIESLNQQLISMRYVHNQLLNCRTFFGKNRKSVEMPIPVEVNPFPVTWVLYTRYRSIINADTLFLQRALELQQILDSYHLFQSGPLIGIFYDGYDSQFTNHEGDLELCLPIIKPEGFKCDKLKSIGDFYMASKTHIGHYKDSYSTY